MPINPFFNGDKFDRETTRIMGVAFEMTRTALGLLERPDQLNEVVARKIIEFAQQGERNPDLLCERVLMSLRERHL